MISTPKCHLSKQVAHKVCIHNKCTHPAFICKHCQKDDCQQFHYHDQNKLQVVRWTQIAQLTQKIEESANGNKWFLQTLDKLQKQINKLIDDVNSIIQIYSKRVQQFDKDRKMDPQFKRVWDDVKEKKWDLITGKQIRILYDRLKQDNFIMNKEVIREMKEKESKNVNLLVDGIQQKLSEYIKKDIVVISQHWGKEDQQKLKKYNQQIRQNPKNSNAYFNRGVLYKNRNQLEKALSDYNKAIEYNPKNSYAYYNRGILYDDKNQLQKALSDYNKAIECDPKFSYAYYNRGIMYKNRNQLDKALSDYTNAITYNPFDSSLHNNRGDIYFKKNMFQEALRDYTKAIECTQKALYYGNRAKVYRKLNMIKQAESDEKKSADLSK